MEISISEINFFFIFLNLRRAYTDLYLIQFLNLGK